MATCKETYKTSSGYLLTCILDEHPGLLNFHYDGEVEWRQHEKPLPA